MTATTYEMNTRQRLGSPLRRYEKNPVLEPENMPFECYTVFNSGAVKFNGKVILLLRTETFERDSIFRVATSDDGLNFTVDPEPIHYPLRAIEKMKWEAHRFDMRITEIEGEYIICHALWLDGLGSTIAMAKTKDFRNFEGLEYVSVPSNRNAVLFPEKINGLYARLERPQDVDGSGQMWISFSPDLVFWGKAEPLQMPVTQWSKRKSGAGAVPIKTEKGWLEIYHATSNTASTENYHLGVMLLDLENPAKVISAPKKFILAPEKDYECIGQVPNVVFTGGAVEMDDGTLNIYYGGADTRMCIAQTTVKELLDFCS